MRHIQSTLLIDPSLCVGQGQKLAFAQGKNATKTQNATSDILNVGTNGFIVPFYFVWIFYKPFYMTRCRYMYRCISIWAILHFFPLRPSLPGATLTCVRQGHRSRTLRKTSGMDSNSCCCWRLSQASVSLDLLIIRARCPISVFCLCYIGQYQVCTH